MQTEIRYHTLSNGLRIMLQELHTAPIISLWLWYGIGSRNEVPGKTGLSHWVEHMQFKGTPSRSGQQMDHAVARVGGYWNAFTSNDWTTYFETMPANTLEQVLSLEADRMRNSLYDPIEVERERTVILSEREGAENDPQFLLAEQVALAAYQTHPYRNEIIGSQADLLAITRDDLYAHYRSYYQPANALLCLAGHFESQAVLDQIEQIFGSITASPVQKPEPQPEYELPQASEIELQGPGETSFLQLSYRCPPGNHADFFAFTILDSLLTGPSSLNMFGTGGVGQRTSRLYQALVENELAVSVYGGVNATIDPSTYDLNLTLHPQCSLAQLLTAVDREIEALLSQPVPQEELNRAVKQAKALFAYGSDNITNQAFWMGRASSFADYDWFLNYVDKLAAVTPQDVQQTAQRYLQPQRRIVGRYIPYGAAHE